MISQSEQDTGPAFAPARRWRWRGKLLAMGVSLLAVLVAVEVGLRIVGYGADRGPSFQGFVGGGIRLMCYDQNLNNYLDVDLTDPAVRKKFYDDYDVMDMEDIYRYTPYGVVTPCDDREMRPGQIRPKPAGKVRIVAVGDSFTYGHGLKPGDPWPRQLETLLNADGKDRFEVLNCGIGDTDVAATARLLLDHLLSLQPDAVVYGWYLNDPLQSKEFAAANRELMDRSRTEARQVPNRYISVGWETVTGPRRWSAIYDFIWVKLNSREMGELTLKWMNGMYGTDNAAGWAESQRLLTEMAKGCSERGAKLHVAIWPMLIDLGSDYPLVSVHEAIMTACERVHIPCLDLRPALMGHRMTTLILHPDDRHPSKLACRLAAEAIRDHLRKTQPELFR